MAINVLNMLKEKSIEGKAVKFIKTSERQPPEPEDCVKTKTYLVIGDFGTELAIYRGYDRWADYKYDMRLEVEAWLEIIQ